MQDIPPAAHAMTDIVATDYAELLGHLDLAVALNDTDGRIRMINHAFAELFGYSVAEAPSVNIRRFHPDLEQHWQSFREGATRCMSGGRKLLHKDGTTRWVNVHASSVRRDTDTLILTVVEDWTDHKWSDPEFLASTDPTVRGR